MPPNQPSTAAAAPLLSQHASQLGAVYSQPQPYSQQPHQQQQQQVEQHSAALASAIMSGLKASLLDTDPSLQLQGCRLLAAAAARAPALLLQQLVAADCCEHLFEVLRGTLSSCSMSASILALRQQQQQEPGGVAVAVVTEDLQAAAVSALQCLSTQGNCLQRYAPCQWDLYVWQTPASHSQLAAPCCKNCMFLSAVPSPMWWCCVCCRSMLS